MLFFCDDQSNSFFNVFQQYFRDLIYRHACVISHFYTETNITSSKLLQQWKNGNTSKIILKAEVFLFVNVKTEDGWNLSLRQEKANLDERKEINRRILANTMLIFVLFLYVADEEHLFHNVKLEDKQIKWLIELEVLLWL